MMKSPAISRSQPVSNTFNNMWTNQFIRICKPGILKLPKKQTSHDIHYCTQFSTVRTQETDFRGNSARDHSFVGGSGEGMGCQRFR